MNISEIITVLEGYKDKYGDLPVLMYSGDEECFPYLEVESTDVFLNQEVTNEDDVRDGEILNFVALNYY